MKNPFLILAAFAAGLFFLTASPLTTSCATAYCRAKLWSQPPRRRYGANRFFRRRICK